MYVIVFGCVVVWPALRLTAGKYTKLVDKISVLEMIIVYEMSVGEMFVYEMTVV